MRESDVDRLSFFLLAFPDAGVTGLDLGDFGTAGESNAFRGLVGALNFFGGDLGGREHFLMLILREVFS